MFNKARMRLGLSAIFSMIAVIMAFTDARVLSGWAFAISLYYLHLNTEHS